jgi:hypothetical protein
MKGRDFALLARELLQWIEGHNDRAGFKSLPP